MDRSSFNPQVGEDVRIRSWEDMAKEFGVDENGSIPCRFSFTEGMRKMCGDEFIIAEIKDGRYFGHSNEYVSISIDMIEPVPEDEIDGAEIDEFLSCIKVN